MIFDMLVPIQGISSTITVSPHSAQVLVHCKGLLNVCLRKVLLAILLSQQCLFFFPSKDTADMYE